MKKCISPDGEGGMLIGEKHTFDYDGFCCICGSFDLSKSKKRYCCQCGKDITNGNYFMICADCRLQK